MEHKKIPFFLEQKAKTNGGVLGFNIPFGYNYVNGELTVNKDESFYVKEIFNLYYSGSSMKKIAESFNKRNIPTKQNKKWGSQTISLILKNPLYCGYLHWEDYLNPGNHEPIIEKSVFNKIQNMIKSRNSKLKNNSKIIELPE